MTIRSSDATKHAEEDAANNIIGITVVNGAIKKQACDNGLSKKTEQHDVDNETLNHVTSNSNITADNVIDDEESDDEQKRLEAILKTFTPERLQVRILTKQTKAPKAPVTLKQNLGALKSSVAPVTLKKNLGELNSSVSHDMPNKQQLIGEPSINNAVAKVPKNVDSARDMIDAMFDSDSQKLASILKRAASGRQRLAGTSDSPKSASLMDEQAVEDYHNEIFSSGDEHYDVQWANINKKYRQSIRQNDKGFTTSEDEDATEEILNDITEGDQIRSKPKVNVECALLQQIHSPGVISVSHELEYDEQFLDTQYLNDDEDTVNQERD